MRTRRYLIPDLADRETLVMLLVLTEPSPLTYGALVEATGYSRDSIHKTLHRLRDLGLVTFEDRKHGTLRPACVPVSFS